MSLNLENTEIAFRSQSVPALRRTYWLFKTMGQPILVRLGPALVTMALRLRLPVKGLIRATLFRQFCGGESIADCTATIDGLARYGIGTILDYSVEGAQTEADYERTTQETLRTIELAASNQKIPFCVFKVTGIGRFALLAKCDALEALSAAESQELARLRERIHAICAAAHAKKVRVLIDAEESWVQNTIDALARDMMRAFNREGAIVYTTSQMYRVGRLDALAKSLADAEVQGYYLGIKLVRGAYMEKERARAARLGFPSPIQPHKQASDEQYDAALRFCVEHIDRLALCAGTHNEASTLLLTNLMGRAGLEPNDARVYFSQLYGMGDHLSYNLAAAGYNVAKYVPYGPVEATLPYLFRRASENTSVKGQASRELKLIEREIERRRRTGRSLSTAARAQTP